jgi:putative chitinase
MLSMLQFGRVVGCTQMTAGLWYVPFTLAMAERQIDSAVRIAQFLAHVGHESNSLGSIEENLNYSAQRLMAVWPRRFPSIEKARFYEHAPERLANFVYGGRFGNGGYESGDGWRYHGRGPFQLTFADNYRAAGKALNLSLIERPELVLEPKVGAKVAAWYWDSRNCNECADDVEETTRRINGGLNGLQDRIGRFAAALKFLEQECADGRWPFPGATP